MPKLKKPPGRLISLQKVFEVYGIIDRNTISPQLFVRKAYTLLISSYSMAYRLNLS